MKNQRLGGLRFLALLCVGLGCSPSGSPEAVELLEREGAWVKVGHGQELREAAPGGAQPEQRMSEVRSPPPPGKAPAIQAWREAPSEDSALGLARAFLPRLSGSAEVEEQKVSVPPAMALRVTPAATEDGQLEVSTRGYVFKVRPGRTGTASVSRREPGALFYGARHFWAAAGGPSAEESGLWRTPRVDELVVLEGGGAPYRASYEVELPEGITAVRDAGEYLEFLEGQDVPVARLHYPVARDGEGRSRQGAVRLGGIASGGSREPGGLTRLALEGGTLKVEMEVELQGLVGPTLVSPGWSSAGSMATPRMYARSALLPDGKVLVMGGQDYYDALASAELYDPATGAWSATGSMSLPRSSHTAVVLANGKVLVVGGNWATSDAELYDPATGAWSIIPGEASLSSGLTATLLLSGKVLVVGGSETPTSYVYDPATGVWAPTSGPMLGVRSSHTATLLPDGRVLVTGGSGYYSASSTAELYDPETDSWRAAGSMSRSRYLHTATLLPDGQVLVAGGRGDYYGDPSTTAELYDPTSGTWRSAAPMPSAHSYHTATLLPDGRVLVALGEQGYYGSFSADIYNPATGTWSTTASPAISRAAFTATLLPGGRVLVAGGSVSYYGGGAQPEIFDPAAGAWRLTGSLATARSQSVATLLPNGKVWVAGGEDTAHTALAQAEQYDVAAGTWSGTAPLGTARTAFTVTTLPSGKVLVVGGHGASGRLASVELYESSTGTWSPTGSLATARAYHTATLLPGGKVLVTGGEDASGPVASAELYDVATGTWSSTGALGTARSRHTTTLLPGGKVLVSGGEGSAGPVARAELYDVATGTWSPTGALVSARSRHTATMLSGGRVLLMGGVDASNHALATTELYNPLVGRWSSTALLATARAYHTATVLLDGRVLVTGGEAGGIALASMEVYDPAKGTFSSGGSLATARARHTAMVLPDGRVLVVGGATSAGALASAELYDDTGALDAWRPLVAAPGPVKAGGLFSVSGFGFRGASEASGGGSYSAATNFPLVQLTALEGGGRTSLPRQDFSDSSVTVRAPAGADGYYLLTVTTNAISAGTMLFIDGRAPTAPVLTSPDALVSTTAPVIGGTAEAGSTVTVTLDGVVVGTALANASGTWSFTPASALAQGGHAVSATSTDAAGNTGAPSEVRTFTVDTVAPAAPVLTAPAALVNSLMPTIEGTAEAGSTVTVSVDGAVVGTTMANASGAWSFTPDGALAQGAHVVTARATDEMGNRSTSSAPRGFTVDTVAPAAPVLTSPAALTNTVMPVLAGTAEAGSLVTVTLDGAVVGTALANASGAWSFTPALVLAQGGHTVSATSTDGVGNTSAPSMPRSFTVDSMAPAVPVLTSPSALINTVMPVVLGTAEAGSTVRVTLDGMVVGSVTPQDSGAWSFTLVSPLAQGFHTVTATATDAAGNTSAPSTARGFTVDSVAPSVPGLIGPGALVNTATPTLRGVAEAGSTVTVMLEGVVVGTTVANASGAWSFMPASPLAQGAHTATATATDEAGNTSSLSAPLAFTVDSVAPVPPVLAAPAAFVNTPTPAIGGTAEAGSTVTVVLDGVAVGSAIANASGAWNFTPGAPLAEGAHTAYATAMDAAGNTSQVSTPRIVTVDTMVPEAPVLTSPGSTVTTSTPVIDGTAEAGSTVTVMVDGLIVGAATANASGAWSLTPASPLAQGTHTAYASARDAAGNTSPWSAPLTFRSRK